MSIDGVLQSAVARGDLVPMPMALPSDPQERVMLLGEEVAALVLGPFVNRAHERRASQLRADLESFVKGEEVSISFAPRKARNANFGLLEPFGDATWDYRSRKPSPGLRLLGRFVRADTFVALNWWPRSLPVSWSRKEPLSGSDLKWRIAIHDCDEEWHRILPGLIPVAGTKAERYVSESFFIV